MSVMARRRPLLLRLWLVGALLPLVVAGAPASATAKRHKRYCTKQHHPKGCVKIPKGVRPKGSDQQGSGSLTPDGVVDGGGLGGGPLDDRRANALKWVLGQRGSSDWSWYCERLVEEAYGIRGAYPNAAAAYRAMGIHPGSISAAPRGALVFFRADSSNRGFGHVGLSLGGGSMISALDTVRAVNAAGSRYWRSLYLGWADAPEAWPGRIPPPPDVITDFDANAMVRITAPAPGSRLSGSDIPLLASASGVAGVEFDAYYATDPRVPTTRGWHALGRASQEDGGWAYHLDTTQIPDQGYPEYGTVNIAAISIDAAGRRSGVRDYRRIDIVNSTAATPPTPTATSAPGATPAPAPDHYETTGGAANTWTDYATAGGAAGPQVAAYATIAVSCRVEGFRVADGNTWWYRIKQAPWSDQYYVSADAFYNNGQTSGSLHGTPFVDPPVPPC